MASISFPAIGTGNLGFPRDLVSNILLSEIYAFSTRVAPQYLSEVTVIVHPSDRETVKVLEKSPAHLFLNRVLHKIIIITIITTFVSH